MTGPNKFSFISRLLSDIIVIGDGWMQEVALREKEGGREEGKVRKGRKEVEGREEGREGKRECEKGGKERVGGREKVWMEGT